MKAIFFEQHGSLEVLKHADLAEPKPSVGEALIKVKAVSLNHLDIWVRFGWEGLRLKMPHVTGSDIAGEIVSVPGNVAWTAGTRVVVNPGFCTTEDEWTRRGEDSVSPGYRIIGVETNGGLAQYVSVPANCVYKLPDHVSFDEGAAGLLTGLTCWRMLFKRASLSAGEIVLVVGSGGGLNSLAISFAKAAGAKVFALTSSKEKMRKAEELGCDEVISYKDNPQWHIQVLKSTHGRGVDLVVDNVGAKTFARSLKCVRRGGRIVTVGSTSGLEVKYDNSLVSAKQVSIIGSTMGSRQDFVDAMQFMWSRDIKPVIDRTEPLKKGIEMIQYLEEGKQFGKIVLRPW